MRKSKNISRKISIQIHLNNTENKAVPFSLLQSASTATSNSLKTTLDDLNFASNTFTFQEPNLHTVCIMQENSIFI